MTGTSYKTIIEGSERGMPSLKEGNENCFIARGIESLFIEDTDNVVICRKSTVYNYIDKDGFSNVGVRTSAIKLAMASTKEWWCRFQPLLVC